MTCPSNTSILTPTLILESEGSGVEERSVVSILWTSVGSIGVYAPVVKTVVAIEGRAEKPGVYKAIEKALAGRVGSNITRFNG